MKQAARLKPSTQVIKPIKAARTCNPTITPRTMAATFHPRFRPGGHCSLARAAMMARVMGRGAMVDLTQDCMVTRFCVERRARSVVYSLGDVELLCALA